MNRLRETVRRTQHQDITEYSAQEMLINALCAVLFLSILWPTGPSMLAWVGIALMVGSDILILACREIWMPTVKSRENIDRALNAYKATSLAHGVGWFILLMLAFENLAGQAQLAPLLVLISGFMFAVTGGAVIMYGMHLPKLLYFIVPANLAGALQIFRFDDPALMFCGIAFVAFLAGIVIQSRYRNRSYIELIEARYRNDQLLAAYKQQKEIAEQSSRAKTRFLAAASHDLRQPIHAIGLLVDTLEVQAQTPDLKVLSQSIGESVNDLTSLLEVILDISRINAGLVKADEQSLPISRVLGNLHKRFSSQALDKGLDFRVRNSDVKVHADRALVERILGNLVSNAIKYTERGGVLVGVRKLSGDSARIDIWDTGVGIPRDSLDEIFLEYYQVGNLARASTEGLGLGLSIVKGLCDMLGYKLSVQSRPGYGSVFSIVLPLADPTDEPSAPAPTAEPADADARVLVIDDDQRVLGATHQLLARRGYDVRIATGQGEAVDIIDRGFLPDIVFCDYRLDEAVRGSDVLNVIRQRFGQHIRGVLITADTDPRRLVEASESGYVLRHKPLSANEIRRTLAQLTH
ncbi:MAG: hybrid sensor histidine kinase/response regulator [Pseudomonadota bacterium]